MMSNRERFFCTFLTLKSIVNFKLMKMQHAHMTSYVIFYTAYSVVILIYSN